MDKRSTMHPIKANLLILGTAALVVALLSLTA